MKVFLVTGAANGIGRATALAAADSGADVCIVDIDDEGLDKVRGEIEERGRSALTIKADVSVEEDVTAMVGRTIEEMGQLDVLVSNAGVAVSGPPDLISIEDWKWIAGINMWAHVYAIRAALPYFRERNSGHFVHVASAAGLFGAPGLAAYSMTKFAVVGLAESLATSLHGTGIGVSVVCPMWVDTDISDRGRMVPDPAVGVSVDEMKKLSREFLRAAGIPPEQVASAIIDGIEHRKFLILPHPEVFGVIQTKWQDPEGFIERAAAAMNAQLHYLGE